MSEQERPTAYESVIADLRARKEQEIRQISEKYDTAISALEDLMGAGALTGETGTLPAGEITIRVGEFHGMPNTSAASVILDRTNKQPLRTEEILRYIERSGRKFQAANPAGNLYSSLKRNPDFELVAPNTWGLRKWYPGSTRKSKPIVSVAQVEEIMKTRAPISLTEAVKQAENESDREEQKGGPPGSIGNKP